MGWNTLVCLIISLRGKSASYSWHVTKRNHKRLQKTFPTKYEIVIKDDLRDTWSNTALNEFG